ncbi:MAG: SIR2 family protein [Flavobacteriales bacterium]|nr:SIR2 family protein [Flavobacteriales bacterium]
MILQIAFELVEENMMTRISAPPPPKDLIEQMKAQKVVPIIGAGLSKSAQIMGSYVSALPTYYQLLESLLERSNLEPNVENVIRVLLDAGEKNPRALEKAARELREEMGDYPFYKGIRAVLEPIDAHIQESMGHKLLRMLNFRRILTTNYDRFIERFVAPDFEVFTARDIETFRMFLAEPERGFILKLHGDITRPETIPFGLSDLYRHYGYESDGTKLVADPSVATKLLREFLESTFRTNTVLFLGSSLSEAEGYARLLTNLVREWGGSLPNTHYALVPKNVEASALRGNLAREMNIKYIEYEPDQAHSQVWEFISYLNAGVYDDKPQPNRKWGQSYLPSRRVEYLERQLEREQTAHCVYFLTPSLTNAITIEEELIATSKQKLEERFSDIEYIEAIIQSMTQRQQNLEARLVSGDLEVHVLFLETELSKAFDASGEQLRKTIERYTYLLKLIAYPNLEVRLIPRLTAQELRDNYSASFAIIFNDTNSNEYPESDVTIAYASQATVNYFEIHIIQINTTEVRDRVYQFERFWNSAIAEKKTIQIIADLIQDAQRKM